MARASAKERRSLVARLAAPLAALLLCAACTDGYPTEDEPMPDPEQMDAGHRLKLMNQIGAQAHAKRHWHYRFGPGCTLRVETRGEGRIRQSLAVDLLATRIRTFSDPQDGTFDVRAIPSSAGAGNAGPADSEPVTLLESERWTDAVRMEWLLQLTQGECRTSRSEGSAMR